jgi:hypothetical protein
MAQSESRYGDVDVGRTVKSLKPERRFRVEKAGIVHTPDERFLGPDN